MAAQPLTFIIQSSAPERVHYALMMAASNAAIGGAVTLFFAMGAAALLKPGTMSENEWAAFEAKLARANVASPNELLAALSELEARIGVCDAALAYESLEFDALRSDIAVEVTGLTDILAHLDGGQIIYV
jgi:peroxiredoxin family protein